MGINPVLQAGLLNQSSAQVIDGSLKFDGSRSTALKRTPSSDGNRKTWTWSAWVKKHKDSRSTLFSAGATSNDTGFAAIEIESDEQLRYSGWNTLWKRSNDKFRDYNQFYHIVVAFDVTQGTASNRVRLYKNGVEITNLANNSSLSNVDYPINDNVIHYIGGIDGGGGENLTFSDYNMTQVYFIDGQQLGPENFGFTDPLTNTWRPKKYTGDFNIGASDYTGVFAPYSATARLSSFGTAGTVTENATGYTLPMSNPSHYGGKALAGSTGGFYIDTVNSATEDFFMGCWLKIDTLVAGDQMGVDIGGSYKYFEIRSNGVIGIRHVGGGRQDSSNTNIGDGNWHHIALSRSGGTMYAYLDGVSKITTTAGVSGNSISENETFNFFGASFGGGYDIDGHMIDAFVYIGQGVSSNFSVPTAPLIDSSGAINHYSGFSDSQLYYASPLVTVSGSSPNSLVDYNQTGVNSFYLPFDGISPIGQDKSGKGNNWTPINFGSSNSLEKATGALPILNTVNGGGVATAGVRTDENSSNLVLALPLAGDIDDLHHIIKGSGSAKTFTASGDPAVSSIQSNFYGLSYLFDGSGDYLTSSATGTDMTVGTGAFTMEYWGYFNSLSASPIVLSAGTGGFSFGVNSSGNPIMYRNGSGGWGGTWSTATISTGRWHHLAAVKEDGSSLWEVFVDGVSHGTKSGWSGEATTSPLYIGNYGNGGGQNPNAYISDVRIYKGVAKYTEDFIPASTSPDILPDTPSGVSGGSKLAKITDGALSFDGSGDYLTSTSSDYAFGTGDFTVEAYVYLDSLINWRCLATTRPNNGGYTDAWHVGFDATGRIPLYSNDFDLYAPSGSISAKKWTHVVVTRDNSTARIFVDGKLVVSGTVTKNYTRELLGIGDFPTGSIEPMKGQISNLRIIKGSIPTEYQTSSTTAGTQVFTPPTAPLTNVTNTKLLCCQSNTSALAAAVSPTSGANDGTVWSESVTPSNTSTQFPLVRGFDGVITGDGGTSGFAGWLAGAGNITITFPSGVSVSNTINIYHGDGLNGSTTASITVDGTTTTSSASSGYVTTKSFTGVSGNLESITLTQAGGGVRFYGIAIDGAVLKDPLAVNGDVSATTFNPFNTNINTVRGQETGYATMNPLDNEGLTLSDGNLNVTNMGTTRQVHADIFVDSGKWYAEFTCKAAMNDTLFGVANNNGTSYLGYDTNSWGVISINGNRIHNQSQSSYGSSFTAGDVISVALDRDNGKWYAAKNGVYFDGGNPLTGANPAHSGLTGNLTFAVGSNNTGGDVSCNFGQKPFKFPPPEGFQPLNAANVRPETVIARPDQYFNTTLWSGNNADPRQIDLGMAPDLIWVKAHNQANWHWLSDSLRGTADKRYKWYANSDSAQDTAPIYGQADSFNEFGFVAGGGTHDTDSLSDSNKTGTNYICWSWKAGGSKGTFNKDDVGYASAAAAGLSGQSSNITIDGCSIGTKQGFSMVKVTPSDNSAFIVPHGLSQQPDFLIIKNLGATQNNDVYFRGVTGSTQVMELNTNLDLTTTGVTLWSAVDSTKVHARAASFATNGNSRIVYFWHSVPGFSKFGTYEGNNSADGTYVELGFRPALIWVKNVDADAAWKIIDARLDTYNPSNTSLDINTYGTAFSNAENDTDILSNGFKLRSNHGARNASNTYLYCAWAEKPSFNLYGAQSNAR